MSRDIALKIHKFIEELQLIKENDTVVLGLSGGVDSMVLCDVLLLYKRAVPFRIFAAHLDHKLRDESGEDALFVASYCEKNSIPLYSAAADVMTEAKEAKVSIETAARYARHGFFNNILSQHPGAKLAVAHHMNDMAETILIRLIRGTSLDGLSPMPPCDGHIIRPLMCITRDEVMEYAGIRNIKWREDKSNTDTVYTRNYIRHKLIPEIEKNINPSVVQTLCAQAKSYFEDSAFIKEFAANAAEKAEKTDNGFMLNDEDFAYLNTSVRKRAIKLLLNTLGKKSDIYEKNLAAIDAMFIKRRTGAVIEIPGEYEARSHVMGVELVKKETIESEIHEMPLNMDGATHLSNGDIIFCEITENLRNAEKPHSKNMQYIDYLTLKENPMVRAREQGDFIHPLGTKGKKKLKDYFIDKKINRWERDAIPLIAIGNEIVWVVGVGVNEKYKLDDKTTLALKITYKKGDFNV